MTHLLMRLLMRLQMRVQMLVLFLWASEIWVRKLRIVSAVGVGAAPSSAAPSAAVCRPVAHASSTTAACPLA